MDPAGDPLALAMMRRQHPMLDDSMTEWGFDPSASRLSVLPNPNGSFNPADWTAPQWLYDMAKAVALPGHVARGGAYTPRDVTSMALNVGMMGSAVGANPAGSLAANTVRRESLPMDAASRMARAKELGYEEMPFYRADGGVMSQGATSAGVVEYPGGASFSRDPKYNDKGTFGANREFRLNLQNTLFDEAPVTAEMLGRFVASAMKHDQKLAEDLAGQFDKTPEWMLGFAKARPDHVVYDNGAVLRAAAENSRAQTALFLDAGVDAISAGHEVKKLNGFGIRLADAAFDPAKKDLGNIKYALGPGGAALPLAELSVPNSDEEKRAMLARYLRGSISSNRD